ncbi:hypothetical protein O6H91_18G057900 [Diphasiastrum complanatum]|uniref:Uncharacterized protein n=1 Tax=Diphasiastrum complanatum TaxID=34168 RepID=A0ACC2B1L4_DIPCM|nr:hypothetical protein O6H91_Y209100 [Diphasiastrum complanatum]KAJ7523669.1 hypothetical protein O6H91_18G057900 [Diphasiastrum complanatum]
MGSMHRVEEPEGNSQASSSTARNNPEVQSGSSQDSLIQDNLAVLEGAFAREPANRGVIVFNLPGNRRSFIDDLSGVLETKYNLSLQLVEDPGTPELPLAVRAFNPVIEPRPARIQDIWVQNETFQHTELMAHEVMTEIMHVPSASCSAEDSDDSEHSQDEVRSVANVSKEEASSSKKRRTDSDGHHD